MNRYLKVLLVLPLLPTQCLKKETRRLLEQETYSPASIEGHVIVKILDKPDSINHQTQMTSRVRKWRVVWFGKQTLHKQAKTWGGSMKLMLAQRVVAQNDSWEALLVREKINESRKISGVPRCRWAILKKPERFGSRYRCQLITVNHQIIRCFGR